MAQLPLVTSSYSSTGGGEGGSGAGAQSPPSKGGEQYSRLQLSSQNPSAAHDVHTDGHGAEGGGGGDGALALGPQSTQSVEIAHMLYSAPSPPSSQSPSDA